MTQDETLMREALKQAKKAAAIGEAPIGAIVVKDGVVIARGYNTRERDKDALCHAEITAIRRACKKLGGWRLWQCELYVTLEPCPMCAGAIINSRLRRVVYGAADPKAGAMGSVCDLTALPFNHRPEVQSGVLAEPCAQLLRDFFAALRDARR